MGRRGDRRVGACAYGFVELGLVAGRGAAYREPGRNLIVNVRRARLSPATREENHER